jgi:hypothetical protein
MFAEADPLDWGRVLRQAVIPVASAYAVFVAILIAYRRQRRADATTPPAGEEPTYRTLVRYLVNTAVGGYAVFLVIVAVFYLVLGGQTPRLLREALVEGSVLAFGIVIPGFLLISWLHDRRS